MNTQNEDIERYSLEEIKVMALRFKGLEEEYGRVKENMQKIQEENDLKNKQIEELQKRLKLGIMKKNVFSIDEILSEIGIKKEDRPTLVSLFETNPHQFFMYVFNKCDALMQKAITDLEDNQFDFEGKSLKKMKKDMISNFEKYRTNEDLTRHEFNFVQDFFNNKNMMKSYSDLDDAHKMIMADIASYAQVMASASIHLVEKLSDNKMFFEEVVEINQKKTDALPDEGIIKRESYKAKEEQVQDEQEEEQEETEEEETQDEDEPETPGFVEKIHPRTRRKG